MKLLLTLVLTALIAGCGKDGAAGANGTNGTDNRFVAGILCMGTVTGLTGASAALNGVGIVYRAVLTYVGDVLATAEVDNGSFQVSGTSFYSVQQNGASTASVVIVADVSTANGGFWDISLNRTTLVTTVVYTDSSLAADSPVTITFAANACTSQSY